MTTCLLIDPFTKTVTTVKVKMADYKAILSVLQAPMMDTTAFLLDGKKRRAFVDDEGLCKPNAFCVVSADQYSVVLAGRVLLADDGQRGGNTVSCSCSPTSLLTRLKFVTSEVARRLLYQQYATDYELIDASAAVAVSVV